jgi:phage I-like protein
MEIVALTVALSHPEGNIGKLTVVIPYGKFEAPDGALKGVGPWTINNEQGRKLAKSITKDILIDYEHQSILSLSNGKEAPAAGWAKDFEWIDDVGLTANTVQWTSKAANMIRENEYRYLSPVFNQNADKVPHSLISIALTNSPALQLPSVALTRGYTNMKDILNYLKMPESSTEDDVINHLKTKEADVVALTSTLKSEVVALTSTLKSEVAALTSTLKSEVTPSTDTASTVVALSTLKNILSALGLPDTAGESEIINTIKSIKEVPTAALQALQQEVTALKQGEIDRERKELIQVALSDGRLLPYLQDWANSIDLKDLKSFVENAKPIVALSSMQSPGMKEPERGSLSEIDESICNQMNLNREDYLKMKRGK